jgi:hypothetical protein
MPTPKVEDDLGAGLDTLDAESSFDDMMADMMADSVSDDSASESEGLADEQSDEAAEADEETLPAEMLPPVSEPEPKAKGRAKKAKPVVEVTDAPPVSVVLEGTLDDDDIHTDARLDDLPESTRLEMAAGRAALLAKMGS